MTTELAAPAQGESPAPETADVSPETIADRIANVGEPQEPTEGTSAPQGDNSEQAPTSTEGQPVKDKAQSDSKQSSESKEVAPDAKATTQPQTDKPAEKAAQPISEENLKRLELGLPPIETEAETVENYKKKHEASSREAHRRVLIDNAKEAHLKSIGLEFVQKADGKFALKATDKYFEELKEVPDIYSQLSEDSKELVTPEVAKEIAKLTMATINTVKPKAETAVEDAVLGDELQDQVLTELAARKIPGSNNPIFADIGKDEVQKEMGTIFFDPHYPAMDSFRKWANKSKENFELAMNMTHALVFRRDAPKKAMLRDQEIRNENQKKAVGSMTTTAPRTNPGQMTGANGKSVDVADRIANASV